MAEADRVGWRGLRGVASMVGMAMVLVAAGVLVIFRSGAHESTVAEPGHQPFRPNSPHPVQPPERIGSVELAGKIAFASQAGGGLFHIHLINADGTGETTLTSGPGEDRDPAWSPDRTRIAFVRHAKPTDLLDVNTDIYVIAADGTGPSRLTDGPEAEGDPAWSPDGSRIAFFATDSSTGRRHIAVRRIDGAGQADLSDPPERCNDREPTWSPDAMRLVFVRKCGDEPSALYLTGADGQGLLLLTQFGRTPDWSPDGARIVYTGLGLHGPSVYVMKADGSGKTQLTDGRPSGDPEWSPDGTKIVFAGTDLATVHLFIMDADGSNVRRLTSKPAEDVTASW